MSILNRFSDIMSSNINDFFEKNKGFFQKSKIKNYKKQLQQDINQLQAQFSGIKGQQANAKIDLDFALNEIAKFEKYIIDAKNNGDVDSENKFTSAKRLEEEKLKVAIENYNSAKQQTAQFEKVNAKLMADMNSAINKIDELEGKISNSQALQNTQQINIELNANLEKIEQEVNRKLDYQNAMDELNKSSNVDLAVQELMKKYD